MCFHSLSLIRLIYELKFDKKFCKIKEVKYFNSNTCFNSPRALSNEKNFKVPLQFVAKTPIFILFLPCGMEKNWVISFNCFL